jgi:hypothetical protein
MCSLSSKPGLGMAQELGERCLAALDRLAAQIIAAGAAAGTLTAGRPGSVIGGRGRICSSRASMRASRTSTAAR